jgi:hypothetical protein
MQLTLSEEEAHVLSDTVKGRIDALLASIARADSRSFKDQLIAEGRMLEGIYGRLGCSHPEWSEAESCDFRAAGSDQA